MSLRAHGEVKLSRRQYEALMAVATRGNRRQAARSMGISEQTLKNLLSQAYRRLGVGSGLAAFRALGWLVPR